MIQNINDFKNALRGGVRTNLFRVFIPAIPGVNAELTTFLVKSATLPPSELGEISVPWRGRKLKFAGDREFPSWTVDVIADVNMDIRSGLEKWSELIGGHQASTTRFVGNDAFGYFQDILVQQLGKNDEVLKTYKLVGAWPKNIQPINLNMNDQDQIVEFQVEFDYMYWESDSFNVGPIGTELP